MMITAILAGLILGTLVAVGGAILDHVVPKDGEPPVNYFPLAAWAASVVFVLIVWGMMQ